MATADASTLTVSELRDILKDCGLPTAGVKSELIARLAAYDPTGGLTKVTHASDDLDRLEDNEKHTDGTRDEMERNRRELDLCRREKAILEREMELARREIALLRGGQPRDAPERASSPTAVNTRGRMSVKSVAELLGYFDGKSEDYPTWEKQVKILQTSYRLGDDETKVLIGMRLRGKAQEWMHSRPDFLELRAHELLFEFEQMFYRRPSKVLVRKQFQERVWRREELFEDYLHYKLIKANRIPIDDQIELVDHVIEGIPDPALKIQARMHCFRTPEALLRAFEKLTLSAASCAGGSRTRLQRDAGTASSGENRRADGWAPRKETRKCYNCNEPNHLSANCPAKARGLKCFRCGQHGHIAPACPRRSTEAEKNVNVVVQSPTTKSCKMVRVNNRAITAIVDTASDLTLMRALCYVRIGAPCLRGSETMFAGIGSNGNETLGKFTTDVVIDGNTYAIRIFVVSDVLLRHDLLLGADFLNTVKLTKSGSEILISKLQTEVPASHDAVSSVPEIFHIEVERPAIDVAHIKDAAIREKLRQKIATYVPNKIREVDVRMDIVLRDDEPVYQRARRLAPPEKDAVNEQIREWLRDGIVQPSLSDYASPVVLVKRKDGSARLCIDYRKLNAKIVKDRYPLPLVEDQLDALQGAKVFSTLDLKNGFFHAPVGKASRKFTSFVVPDGQYEFLRVPFGLCNSPAVFAKFINAVFGDLLRRRVILAYMDDLIVPSKDVESGMRSLESVLSKTLAVAKFPTPKTAKQIRSFLGLSGYFRKFIEGYSLIARPLTDLLRADKKFELGRREMDAFDTLKAKLVEKPVLRLYKVNAETELHTDASRYGFGVLR
ncbi:uncharacterized protein LOC143363699 [Halictus rubicundus]|uniref:uncharacterized protein LOC143363699 n=1 Tax=Halictus rubicundus TaxID=77578 RepID=UPI0040375E21